MRSPAGTQPAFRPRIRRAVFLEAAGRSGSRCCAVCNRACITASAGDPVTEYWQMMKQVAVLPLTIERRVGISRPEAMQFVPILMPRDLAGVPSAAAVVV